MGNGLLSLLLFLCYLCAVIQLSRTESDHLGGSRTPQNEELRKSEAPKTTATISDGNVNYTESHNEAKIVRASRNGEGDRSDHASDEDADKEGMPSSKVEGAKEEVEGTTSDATKKEEKSKERERMIVTHIPELPASIAKPGRLFNASWFIMFYALWCEHSQLAEPEFLEALQMLADSNITGMYAGKIDVTKHGEVAKHFKIKGTPTFAFFKFGVRFNFIDVVNAKNLFDFVTKILTAKVDRLNTTQELTNLQKNHSILFLLVHDEEIDADWHSVYLRTASQNVLDAKFAYTTDPDIVKEHDINRLPCVMVLKDGKAFVYKDALSGYSLTRWIQIEKYLTFPTVNESNLLSHLHPASGRRLAMLVVHGKPSERRIAQKKAIEVVKRTAMSRKLHTKYQFLLLEGAEIAEKLIGWMVDLPSFFVYEPYSGLYYMYQYDGKGLTEESLTIFLHNVTVGVVTPQGGATLLDTVLHVGRLLYAVIMTMVTHRPVLSLATALSLLGASLFYLIIFCQPKQPKAQNSTRTRARKALLKRKKEAAKKTSSEEQKNTLLRKRNKQDDTGIDSEEWSQSDDVRTGTGSGTGTQSEGDSDSQVELRETKKMQ